MDKDRHIKNYCFHFHDLGTKSLIAKTSWWSIKHMKGLRSNVRLKTFGSPYLQVSSTNSTDHNMARYDFTQIRHSLL